MEFLASTAFPFHHAKHLQYVLLSLKLLPHHYVQLDSSRLTALYFIVISLDMLKGIDSPSVSREQLIEFIYMHQLSPSNDEEIIENGYFGFVGGTFLGVDKKTEDTGENSDSSSSVLLRSHRCGHLAMIYTAIMTLLTLNDNLSRIDRISIGKGSVVIAFVTSFSFFCCLSCLFIALSSDRFLSIPPVVYPPLTSFCVRSLFLQDCNLFNKVMVLFLRIMVRVKMIYDLFIVLVQLLLFLIYGDIFLNL
jgi:hypothetical protein